MPCCARSSLVVLRNCAPALVQKFSFTDNSEDSHMLRRGDYIEYTAAADNTASTTVVNRIGLILNIMTHKMSETVDCSSR